MFIVFTCHKLTEVLILVKACLIFAVLSPQISL